MPPLSNIHVLELSTSSAAQIAGMLLADLGADVVRVAEFEDLGRISEPARLCWSRGKTHIGDRRELDRLLGIADILVSDDAPRLDEGNGLDAASLAARAPGLVNVWLPPTAPRGEWTDLPADHILVDGLTGVAAYQQGMTDGPSPTVVPGSQVIQGAIGAVASVAGLVARRRDGWGRSATISGLHAGAAARFALGSISLDGPPALGSLGLLPGPPHMRLYQAGDGQWVYLAAISFEHFIRALEVLDRLDVLADPTLDGEFINVMRPEAMVAIGGQLERSFRERPRDHWLAAMAANNVPAAEVGEPSEWLTGDVLGHASPPITRVSSKLGTVTLPGPALRFEATPVDAGELPDLGAATPSADVWTASPIRAEPSGDRPGDLDLPLTGVRVVDLTTFMAGPFGGALLGICGADVVKVEPTSGDPYSAYNAAYAVMNQHKQRINLDLRQPGDHATFLELVAGADVVTDNLAASSLARLDLVPGRFEDANPSLVRCSVSAYGNDGPHAERPGFDQMVQAISGLMVAQGGADRPLTISFPIHDITTGCLLALGSVAALLARDSGHPGQRVFASLSAASALIQSGEITMYEGRPPRVMGGVDWRGPSSWRRYYQTADGWIAVSATSPADQRRLLDVVEQTGLADAADDDRADSLGSALLARPAQVWLAALRAAGVPACPVADRLEFDLPDLVTNDFTQVLEVPDVGRLRVPSGFVDWADSARRAPLTAADARPTVADTLARWAPPRRAADLAR